HELNTPLHFTVKLKSNLFNSNYFSYTKIFQN
ncbi:unnamed protein product, partial [Plutella xylostella]